MASETIGEEDIYWDDEDEVYRCGLVEFTNEDIVNYNNGGTLLEDDKGQYHPHGGSRFPIEENNFGADACNAVLNRSESRYNEPRYCTQAALRGESYCQIHIGRKNVDEYHMSHFNTGAYLDSYEKLLNYLSVEKQALAIDIFDSLIQESKYDFEQTYETSEITSPEKSSDDVAVELKVPVPTEHTARCQSLWYAALEFVKIQNIDEQLFKDALEEEVVGEREKVVGTTDNGAIREREEHHLNLPLSRIQQKYKEHLKFGGVEIDGDEMNINMTTSDNRFKEITPPDET